MLLKIGRWWFSLLLTEWLVITTLNWDAGLLNILLEWYLGIRIKMTLFLLRNTVYLCFKCLSFIIIKNTTLFFSLVQNYLTMSHVYVKPNFTHNFLLPKIRLKDFYNFINDFKIKNKKHALIILIFFWSSQGLIRPLGY